ncbi:hypothetical protein [Kribbella turkmenica]|uniref:hypothetical protein n=1 Tax=Kribbella turkmenica TaxID=2530375 RepID=UPI00192E10D9|nr:hypothetical protein [Kribbella turkmenica]
MQGLDGVDASDGDLVAAALVQRALTAGEFVFPDGATQVFEPGGGTTYKENGRPTPGEWYTERDGRFG